MNTDIHGTLAAASVTASVIWTVTILDTTPPVVAIQSATAPPDGFLPSESYAGPDVSWSPGSQVPTVIIGTGQVKLEISARDNVAVAFVSVACSPSCGPIAAGFNSGTGLWEASVPIANPLTQLTIQATDPSGNIAQTYLDIQLNPDLDADGIYNNVDGDCTTNPPTSQVFDSQNFRFGDCNLNGMTSGQVAFVDSGIILTIRGHVGGGVDVKATGPSTGKGVIQLDGAGTGKGPNHPILVYGGATMT